MPRHMTMLKVLEHSLDDPAWIEGLESMLAESEERIGNVLEVRTVAHCQTSVGVRRIDLIVRVGVDDSLDKAQEAEHKDLHVLEETSYSQAEVLGYGVGWNTTAQKALML